MVGGGFDEYAKKPRKRLRCVVFLAGAVRIELTTRGFGGGYPYCLKLTYLRYIFLCIIENYDRFTTRLFYLCNVF